MVFPTQRHKLITSLTVVLCILGFGIAYQIKYQSSLLEDEVICDVIQEIENSKGMARVRLLNSNREFTLLVEKYDSVGNFNYDRINWFVQPGKTKLLHQKGSSRVYLVGTKTALLLDFRINENGHLVHGKVERQLSKN